MSTQLSPSATAIHAQLKHDTDYCEAVVNIDTALMRKVLGEYNLPFKYNACVAQIEFATKGT